MLFADVRSSLVRVLRTRVRNGELTERGLAKLVGVSQPHIHNVLKGARVLSPELGDQILQHLRISLLDLIERERLEAHLGFSEAAGAFTYVPVLRGALGPCHQWPTEVDHTEQLPFPIAQVSRIPNPLAVRMAEDPRMSRTFSWGDVALLDQCPAARSSLDPNGFYVIKSGQSGIVRRVRLDGSALYLISDDCVDRPSGWEKIEMSCQQISNFIRARVYFLPPLYEWS